MLKPNYDIAKDRTKTKIEETNLNNAYDYVNQITEIYANNYDGYNFNIDYDTACEIVQLQMEYYSK